MKHLSLLSLHHLLVFLYLSILLNPIKLFQNSNTSNFWITIITCRENTKNFRLVIISFKVKNKWIFKILVFKIIVKVTLLIWLKDTNKIYLMSVNFLWIGQDFRINKSNSQAELDENYYL
jgi:presenilin-like A22 family membrane protease